MLVSEARREANRRNAQKSTGPKTPEGKERSRANALKHGLCSSVVVPEDPKTIQARAEAYFYTLKPQNDFHSWLVDQVALLSLRIDRCERIERRVRDKVALRAELTWDDDRRLEVEALGAQLGRRPGEVVEALRKTSLGCDWLIGRWALLAHAADSQGSWSPEQSRLAFDLIGTPEEFRSGLQPGAQVDREGRLLESTGGPAALARREIAELEARRDLAVDLDEVERALTCSDLTNDSDLELRKLRRYESTLHRRLRWCLAQLKYESPHRGPHPDLFPKWVPPAATEPEPAARPEPPSTRPSPHPPFDLEPDEVPPLGEPLDVPKILASRAEKRLIRAEARREARRRKVERLRA